MQKFTENVRLRSLSIQNFSKIRCRFVDSKKGQIVPNNDLSEPLVQIRRSSNEKLPQVKRSLSDIGTLYGIKVSGNSRVTLGLHENAPSLLSLECFSYNGRSQPLTASLSLDKESGLQVDNCEIKFPRNVRNRATWSNPRSANGRALASFPAKLDAVTIQGDSDRLKLMLDMSRAERKGLFSRNLKIKSIEFTEFDRAKMSGPEEQADPEDQDDTASRGIDSLVLEKGTITYPGFANGTKRREIKVFEFLNLQPGNDFRMVNCVWDDKRDSLKITLRGHVNEFRLMSDPSLIGSNKGVDCRLSAWEWTYYHLPRTPFGLTIIALSAILMIIISAWPSISKWLKLDASKTDDKE